MTVKSFSDPKKHPYLSVKSSYFRSNLLSFTWLLWGILLKSLSFFMCSFCYPKRKTDNNSFLVTSENASEYQLRGFLKQFLAPRENPPQGRRLEILSINAI